MRMAPRRHKVSPHFFLEDKPSHQSVRFGGRYISIRRLSEAHNLDHGYLSRIFNGSRKPTLTYLETITTAMGISVDDFRQYVADRKAELEEKRRRYLEPLDPAV